MKLYELTQLFAELFEQFDAINDYEFDTNADGECVDDDGNIIEDPAAHKENMLTAWFDTLEGIEGEFDNKAENIAAYIKALLAEAKAIKIEEDNLRNRRKKCEKSAESLKTYLLNSMQVTGRKKIDTPRAVISLRNNAPSLVVDNELDFISWAEKNNDTLLKYAMPEIRKADIKKLIKSGEEIPFVHTEQNVSLTIK